MSSITTRPRRRFQVLASAVKSPIATRLFVGLSASALEKKRLSGGGPRFVRLGGRAVGYDIQDLDAWLDEQRGEQPTARNDEVAQ